MATAFTPPVVRALPHIRRLRARHTRLLGTHPRRLLAALILTALAAAAAAFLPSKVHAGVAAHPHTVIAPAHAVAVAASVATSRPAHRFTPR